MCTTTTTTAADSLPICHVGDYYIDNLKVGPYHTYKTDNVGIHMVRVSTMSNNQILLSTPVIVSNTGPILKMHCFPMDDYVMDCLYTITSIEKQLERLLHDDLLSGSLPDLPEMHAQSYLSHPKLRPSLSEDKRCYFIKLAKDVQVYSWNGEPLPSTQCGPGEYQLLLRISNIYFGQHGATPYSASAQVRVAQIRYRPLNAALCPATIKKCLLTDGDDDTVIYPMVLNGSTMGEVDTCAPINTNLTPLNPTYSPVKNFDPRPKTIRRNKKMMSKDPPTSLLPKTQSLDDTQTLI